MLVFDFAEDDINLVCLGGETLDVNVGFMLDCHEILVQKLEDPKQESREEDRGLEWLEERERQKVGVEVDGMEER